jgi:DNA mismatch endonuclease (patch repair protein)
MRQIRGKDTLPELRVRGVLHSLGFRFRIHVATLPGRPDIVLPKYRAALFVHGCFWHRHSGCKYRRMPKRNQRYWVKKLLTNQRRDSLQRRHLRQLGWRVFTIWECETEKPRCFARKIERLAESLRRFVPNSCSNPSPSE